MEEQKKQEILDESAMKHQPVRVIEDDVMPDDHVTPPSEEVRLLPQPFLSKGKMGGFMGMAAMMIAGLLQGKPAGGIRLKKKPENTKLSTAARKLKAWKRRKLDMQKASRKANRGTKGRTAFHTHR